MFILLLFEYTYMLALCIWGVFYVMLKMPQWFHQRSLNPKQFFHSWIERVWKCAGKILSPVSLLFLFILSRFYTYWGVVEIPRCFSSIRSHKGKNKKKKIVEKIETRKKRKPKPVCGNRNSKVSSVEIEKCIRGEQHPLNGERHSARATTIHSISAEGRIRSCYFISSLTFFLSLFLHILPCLLYHFYYILSVFFKSRKSILPMK